MTRAERRAARDRLEMIEMADTMAEGAEEAVMLLGRSVIEQIVGFEPDAVVFLPALVSDEVVYIRVEYSLPYRVDADDTV